MSERPDPVQHNKVPEPSLLHTKIDAPDAAKREQLHAKLVEYQTRNAGFDQPLREQVSHFGAGRYLPVMKELVLAAVLDAASEDDRNFAANPILIPEIALKVMDATDVSVTQSVITPFVFNQGGLVYEPDFFVLSRNATPADLAFSEAYAIVKSYASMNGWGVQGGTGLPPEDGIDASE